MRGIIVLILALTFPFWALIALVAFICVDAIRVVRTWWDGRRQ